MSHGITADDKGVVWGDTWHRLPQYVQQETPVTTDQAREVLNFPIVTVPLARLDNGLEVAAACVVRADTGRVLVPHVGLRFEPMDNKVLVDTLEARLLKQYPELVIESVGTLFGGQTAFINVVLERFHVKGDDSATLTRLMYYNPLGTGGYKIGVHNIRIVCNNTLRMAKAQAVANDTMRMIPHTKSAAVTIADTLFDLTRTKLMAQEFIKGVESLVDAPIRDNEDLERLLNLLFPSPDESEEPEDDGVRDEVKNIQERYRDLVKGVFDNGVVGISAQYQRTRYSLLQAVTYVLDHPERISKLSDQAFVVWDGIMGRRSIIKDHALTVLLTA